MKYIDVIVDTKSENVDNFFTYVSEDDSVKIGDMAVVPFARSKSAKRSWIFNVYDELPTELAHVKKFRKVDHIDRTLSLNRGSINVIDWMRNRYYCRYMDAIKCFIPMGKPLKSGKKRELDLKQEEPDQTHELTPEQWNAVNRISPFVEKRKNRIFLLQGVTGSGKTEVYMRLTEQAVSAGRKVIILVPEINLTPQTIDRFLGRFGLEKIAVLHSGLSPGERYDQWMNIKNGEADIVIGARSAVFAPFDDIGLIIVDEEHESTYKSDMTPKYDTVEVAIKRSIQENATVVLGSATPSVVSNYRAKSGLYEKISMTKRYNSNPLPQVHINDMRDELMAGNMTIFSSMLHDRIRASLDKGRQVILFLNRRGYSPFIACRQCGYVMKCEDCGISMTYHKTDDTATCHFCGKNVSLPSRCPECDSDNIKHFGAGTEKVEEIATKMFDDVDISRLDTDTSSKKGSGKKILNDFKKGRTKILIGTQMVAKGLDFANVDLVGIVAADVSLNIPDFRSAERTFQLITQVAGRSGRGNVRGDVVVQTYSPENYAVLHASEHDYDGFYEDEIIIRKTLGYPPFSDIIQITILSDSEENAAEGAERFKARIRENVPDSEKESILGPNSAHVVKLKSDYRYHIHIKSPVGMRRFYEQMLSDMKKEINTNPKAGFRVIIEVNPFSFN